MNNGLLGWSGQGNPIDLDVNTQLFTSSGTWTKPANCEWVRVIVVGGGGGGGGGGKRQQVGSSTERPSGGGGGGGGGASFIDIPAGLLPNQVTVTVGAAGTAGAGATADNGLGGAGGAGGTTSFGNIITAAGGGAGNQGSGGGFGAVAGGNGHILGGTSAYQFFGNPTTSTRGGGMTSGGGQGGVENDQRLDNKPLGGSSGTSPFFEPQKYGIISMAGQGGNMGFTSSADVGTPGTFGSGGGGGGCVRTGVDNNGNTINGANGGVGGVGYCLVSAYSTMTKPVNVQVFKSDGQWNKPTDPRLSTARIFVVGGGAGGGAGRQWASNLGAACTGSYLALSGVAGNYATTPSSAALQITGDIDIQVKVSFWNWNLGSFASTNADRMVLSKWVDTGTGKSYGITVGSGGALSLWWSADGSATLTTYANQNLNYTQNTIKWLRATMDVNNGASQRATKFYTSDDGTTWTQLGTTVTTSGITSIFSNTSELMVGASHTAGASRFMDGRVYRTIIRNGYDGAGSVVFDADFETQSAGTTSFTESSSNAATVTITATTTPLRSGGSGGHAGGVSYSELPLAFLPSNVSVTVGAGGAGGAASTTTYTDGANGVDGGRSSFGTFVSANGGEKGYGGSAVAGPNTNGASVYGSSGGLALGGTNGAGSGAANASNSVATNTFTSGGGGGAGLATAGTTYTGGSSVVPTGYGAILSTVTAGLDGANVFNGEGMFGSTGGGGGSSSGTPTRNGGNGGRGSGGGGGAASNNGTNSGAGGSGGSGYVIVVCV